MRIKDNKLDEILEEHISEEDERMEFRLVVYDYMAMRGKILTLIQEEREEAYNEGYEEGKLLDTKVYVGIEPMKKIQEEAVRGFVEYLKLERKIFYAEPTLFALLEKASAEYLSSIGKDEE